MQNVTYLILIIASTFIIGCDAQVEKTGKKNTEEQATEKTPKEMLSDAYQLFKEGNDPESIELANKVLAIGRDTKNDTLVGKALTSLCRNAQRKLDTTRLAELSAELVDLAASSGNEKWLMYRAHMNAEMWRLIGNMDRADSFYIESMRISKETGSNGMYMIDHFNKSFVSTAKGDYKTANDLIKKYYQLRKEAASKAGKEATEDAYGLIALAYLLEQQKNYKGAHEAAVVTRRLFKEQNLFPEPPDEKPLLLVEDKVKKELPQATLEEISANSASASVSTLLEKYLK